MKLQHCLASTANRTIVVEYGDLHDGSPPQPHLLAVPARNESELQEELLVRLPLVVVHDLYTNLEKEVIHPLLLAISFFEYLLISIQFETHLFLLFSRFKCQDFVNSDVVLRFDGRSVDRLNSHFDGVVHVSMAEDLDGVRADVLEDGGRG